MQTNPAKLATPVTGSPGGYRDLFHALEHGVTYFDAQGRIIDANPAAVRILGLDISQLRQRSARTVDWGAVHPDGTPLSDAQYPATVALRTGLPYRGVVMGLHVPGELERHWLRIDTMPQFAEGSSEACGAYAVFTDITVQQRAQDTLAATHRTATDIVHSIPAGLFIYQYSEPGDLTLVSANPAAERLTGIVEADWRGRPFDAMWPDAARRGITDRYLQVVRTGEPYEEEIVNYKDTKVSGSFWTRVFALPGQRLGVAFENTTERHRAEAALSESNARFRDLTFIMADWVWETDAQGRYTYVSDTVQDALGIPASEMIGRTPFEFMSPEEGARVDALFRPIAARREPFSDLDNLCLHRDGTHRHFATSGVPILAPDGTLLGFRGCDRDITDRKRLEQQYLRSQRFESIGALASGVAHDLNNVLAPILMAIDMLSDSLTGVENRGVLDMLRTSARRGTGVVRQLLAFSRGTENQRTRVNTRYVIREIAEITAETFPRSIRVDTRLCEDLWDLHADSTQVHQILLNLCVNARDAMPNGGQLRISADNAEIDEVYARMNADAKAGRFVRLTVTDSGVGMSRELLGKVFEPFFTTKAPGQGTGLGLASVLSIVKNHGGFLEVNSRLHSGTEFRIYLPASPDESNPGSTTDTRPPIPRGAGETILVVDDENALRNIAAAALVRYGYKTLQATDGAEALTAFALNQDLVKAVVVDMNMPMMDGATTIMALRRLRPSLPVVAMSGLPEQEIAARKASPDHLLFLQKPFAADELLRAVDEALRAAPPAPGNPLKT